MLETLVEDVFAVPFEARADIAVQTQKELIEKYRDEQGEGAQKEKY